MPRFKKGSAAAKRYMAKLRRMQGRTKKRKTNKRAAPKKRRRSNPVARRKKNNKKRSVTIPLAPTLGLVAGISPALFGMPGAQGRIQGAVWHFQHGGPAAGLKEFVRVGSMTFTGYDPEGFEPFGKHLGRGLGPVIAGFLVHFVASKLGINRMLGAAKVPFIRI